MALHDEDAWRPKISCTDAITRNAREKLMIPRDCHSDEQWASYSGKKESAADASGKRSYWWEPSGLALWWRIYDHALVTMSDVRTNLTPVRHLNTGTSRLSIRSALNQGLHMSMTESRIPLPYGRLQSPNTHRYMMLRGSDLFKVWWWVGQWMSQSWVIVK